MRADAARQAQARNARSCSASAAAWRRAISIASGTAVGSISRSRSTASGMRNSTSVPAPRSSSSSRSGRARSDRHAPLVHIGPVGQSQHHRTASAREQVQMDSGAAHPAVHAPTVLDRLGGEQPGHRAAGGDRPAHRDPRGPGHDAALAAVRIDAGHVQRVGRPAAAGQDHRHVAGHDLRGRRGCGQCCVADLADPLRRRVGRHPEQVAGALLARGELPRRRERADHLGHPRQHPQFGVQSTEVAGLQHRGDHRSRRRAHDTVRSGQVDARRDSSNRYATCHATNHTPPPPSESPTRTPAP